jgi:hypothetical protein
MCRCGYFYFNDGYCLHGLFKIIRWPKIIKFYDKKTKEKKNQVRKMVGGLVRVNRFRFGRQCTPGTREKGEEACKNWT